MGSQTEAEAIATLAIEKDLAKCVNIIPNVTSIYRWKDKIEKEAEVSLLFKTSQHKINALRDFIQQNHPYEVPAILENSVETTSLYFKFIEEEQNPND